MNNEFDFNSFKNMSCNNFIDHLLTLSPNELSLLGVAIGFLLTINTNANQQESLGNFFELIGQYLLTSSAQLFNLENTSQPTTQQLQQQINYLKKELEILKNSNS